MTQVPARKIVLKDKTGHYCVPVIDSVLTDSLEQVVDKIVGKADKLYQQPKICSNGVIDLEDNVGLYYHAGIDTATTFSFNSSALTKTDTDFTTFEVVFRLSTVVALTFPSEVHWVDEETPDLSSVGLYMFAFRQLPDSPGVWYGCLEGRWAL